MAGRSLGALLLGNVGVEQGHTFNLVVFSHTFRLVMIIVTYFVFTFSLEQFDSNGADSRIDFRGRHASSGLSLSLPSPLLLFPHSGMAFLSLSFLVSHQAEGRQNQGGALPIALVEVWSLGVGTGKEGKRLKPQVKECSGKVHSPSLGIPWIILAF